MRKGLFWPLFPLLSPVHEEHVSAQLTLKERGARRDVNSREKGSRGPSQELPATVRWGERGRDTSCRDCWAVTSHQSLP